MICTKCGKTTEGKDVQFCPYCGERLAEAGPVPEFRSEEAEKWVRKALSVTSYLKRKEILLKGQKEFPDSREIEWELLFIGAPDPKPVRGQVDFSIIKSWLLQIYRTPDDFSEEKRDAMRRELFEGAQLQKTLSHYADPAEKTREYLLRLCREYIDIFLKEDNRLMGNLFGFRTGRNRAKVLEEAVSAMIRQIEADEALTGERKQMLCGAMAQALNG